MRHLRTHKGFTLIELLVVIAIIGVLSSIVLSALNNARSKGNDAAVKGNLDGARSQAELFYDSNNNKYYGGTAATDVCSISGLVGGVKGVYPAVVAAAQATGATVITAIGGNAAVGTSVTCHSCVSGQGGTSCSSGIAADRWAISAKLNTTATLNYCVDSTGFAGMTTDPLANGDAICG